MEVALAKVFNIGAIPTPEAQPGDNQDPDADPGTNPTPTPAETAQPQTPASADPAADLARALTAADAAFQAGQDALRVQDFTAYDRAQKNLEAALARALEAQARIEAGSTA